MSFFSKPEKTDTDPIIEGLRHRIISSHLPGHVRKVADREIDLLSKIDPSTAEYSIGLTYIEYLLGFPWIQKTEDNLDLGRAEMTLNDRHYGLKRIKSRIIEHLAVKILKTSRKPRVLVVDDEAIALKNMVRILQKEGYSVDSASDGMDAYARLGRSSYDVVLTDLKMEGLDGLSLLEKIKAKTPDTQVIMITGYASIENAIETIKKGAFQYIQKPLKADTLRSTVREALEKKQTSRSIKGSVLCFAGPPGTGKTSMGRAVAEALGRRFSRISLGGIKDEAEIRGHRRTYAGAMPGRIIEEIKRTGVINPVIMLDELDKIGQGFKGDTSSALLEVLDPEQNHSFLDHYLDIPFDLSNVMFIGTANVADNIDNAMLDRMEVISFSGYTEDQKKEIAMRYLIPKQINEKGISDSPPRFEPDSVLKIIHDYTREAGIRNLEREIASVCRKIAMDVVSGRVDGGQVTVTAETIEKYLGPRRYYHEVADEEDRVGVTTGLVWTETGGAIIFVESLRMKGSGELILTGSLGDVMRESAQAALSYIRSNASLFNIDKDFFRESDIHVHVPAGAIPKDGPSAGATIALSLISLLTGKAARRSVAVTGEITLTGRMLPVGGVREKLLAARQAGVETVVFPAKNRVDIDSFPENIRRGIRIQYAKSIDETVGLVLI
jgi:ATP-dependent Lon protease